jgi:hypothetical protein
LLTHIENPILCLSKSNKCIILAQNNQAYFLDEKVGLNHHLTFKFDPSKFIINILIQELYVIVVYEQSVAIYNAATGDMLEEKGKLDKFRYKAAVPNFNGTDIYLVTNNNNQVKNVTLSEVY